MKSAAPRAASYSLYSSSEMARSGFSFASTSAGTSGTCESKYFFVILNTRLQRLPQVFAKSALYTCTMRSSEMEPSAPNCTSLMK